MMKKYGSCYECQTRNGRCLNPNDTCEKSCESLKCEYKLDECDKCGEICAEEEKLKCPILY
jgi:hypothetical protein